MSDIVERLATARNMMELERAAAGAIAEIERLRDERDEARSLAKEWSETCGSEVQFLRRKVQQLHGLLLKYHPKFDGSWL